MGVRVGVCVMVGVKVIVAVEVGPGVSAAGNKPPSKGSAEQATQIPLDPGENPDLQITQTLPSAVLQF